MALPPIYQKRDIIQYKEGAMKPEHAMVVSEIPLTVFLNDTELATLVCTPGSYKELAVGFLLSEGLLHDPTDIKEITYNEDDGLLWVETAAPVPQTENFLRRQIASCCGKGRASLYFVNDASQLEPVQSDHLFSAGLIPKLMVLLEEKSATFRLTGGVHGAALADSENMFVMYEDIGRHNAVDRVLGYAFLNHIDTADKILLLSGRISSEILIKAARRGVPVVVSRSAPTKLALELADQFGVTVVGFARGTQFSIYSHKEKIVL